MTTTDIGRYGEKLASRYLKKNGYKILEKNLHVSHNEIDIIATDKEYIVFVEVKTRSSNANDPYLAFGTPASAVTLNKQRRTIAAANQYLYGSEKKTKHQKKQPRMDVIEVLLDKQSNKLIKINHIINAFGVN